MPGVGRWVVCCAVLSLVGCAHADLEADLAGNARSEERGDGLAEDDLIDLCGVDVGALDELPNHRRTEVQ